MATGAGIRPGERAVVGTVSRRPLRRSAGTSAAATSSLIGRAPLALAPETVAAADEASHALARFDAEAGALAAPFPAILLQREAAASSELANITAGAREVALVKIGSAGSGNARLIVANARALQVAGTLDRDLDEHAVLDMNAVLLRETSAGSVDRWWRDPIGARGRPSSLPAAGFIPPQPELLDDLFTFIQRTNVPLLARAAIAHAQFTTIRPFPDGNGRIGRVLLHVLLRRGGLTRNLTAPISAGLLSHPSAYVDALTAYRGGDPDAIVNAITHASLRGIDNARHLVTDIGDIRDGWNSSVRARSDSAVHRLLDLLPTHPVITVTAAAALIGTSDVAAGAAINRLAAAGILTQTGGGIRYRIWRAPEVLDALDAFTTRALRSRA